VYGAIQRLLRGTVTYWPQPVRTLWYHVTENTPTFVLIYSGLPAHQIQAHQSVKTELSYFVTYHDHAIEITAVNAYFGQAGFYILSDPAVQENLKLPAGDYDVPLMLATKQFFPSGKLLSPENERDSLFGDVNVVNGQP
jgi:hypothetical protein